jgi:hypothetical protein
VVLNNLYELRSIWKSNNAARTNYALISDWLKLKKSSSLKLHMEWSWECSLYITISEVYVKIGNPRLQPSYIGHSFKIGLYMYEEMKIFFSSENRNLIKLKLNRNIH